MVFAIIDKGGIVINTVEYDGVSDFNPDGVLVNAEGHSVSVGDSYTGTTFSPAPKTKEETAVELEQLERSHVTRMKHARVAKFKTSASGDVTQNINGIPTRFKGGISSYEAIKSVASMCTALGIDKLPLQDSNGVMVMVSMPECSDILNSISSVYISASLVLAKEDMK